jgi:serine/threonine protein phosphatase 1
MIYRDFVLELVDPPDTKKRGRFLVVGDVHGQMDMVMRLVRLTGYDPFVDRMIALGDLVDRGPDSADVLRWFAAGTLRTSLLGNHDALLIDSEFRYKAEKIWFGNGGNWSQRHDPFELNLLRRLASGFPLAIRLNLADGRRIGLVHAEVQPGATWKQIQRCRYGIGDADDDRCGSLVSSLLWGRQRMRTLRRLLARDPDDGALDAPYQSWLARLIKPVPGVDLVLCGHSILDGRAPMRLGSHVFIDTGGYQTPDGRLTAVDPDAGVYWQVGHREDEQWGPLPLPAPFEKSLPPETFKRRHAP